jgi:non-ribosomal peptide synthetase component F
MRCTFPWREKKYSNGIAWAEPGFQKTYAQLTQDLDLRAKEDPGEFLFIENESLYENALRYLCAWENEKTLCLIPKTWPQVWRDKAQERLRKFQSDFAQDGFYILPTSGSSGEPKLVLVTRRNWETLWRALLQIYVWPEKTKVAMAFEAVFDPFIALVFLTLSQGATLVPLPREQRFDIFQFMQAQEIEIWASVPSLISLNASRRRISSLPLIRQALFTGETLSPELVMQWQSLAPQSRVENLYGPVEATVWVSRKSYPPRGTPLKVSIGSTLSAPTKLSIQDGELVISGPQVAAGYISEFGLQKFNGVYQTGDRVEEIDGEFYFLGRKDYQTKILGQRIEIEAIENLFLSLTGKMAVGCVDEKQNICLICQEHFNLPIILAKLKDQLPPSHWPRNFYQVSEWPRTASGKLDRKQLQDELNKGRLLPLQSKGRQVGNS